MSKSNASGTFGHTVIAGISSDGTSFIVVEVAVGPWMYSIITKTVVAVPQLVHTKSTNHQKILNFGDLLSRACDKP